jgi:mono/diheme cytochrome c family protein
MMPKHLTKSPACIPNLKKYLNMILRTIITYSSNAGNNRFFAMSPWPLGLTFLMLLNGTAPIPPLPPGDDPPPSDQTLSGEEIYQRECALCHGKQGEGTERGYPLRKPYRPYATHVTREGRAGNPAYAIPMPAYSEAVISDLKLAEIWNFLDRQTSESSGEDFYRAYCQNCHGVDARGGMSQQALDSAWDNFALWVRWGQDDGFYGSRSSYMPRWNSWEISEKDLDRIQSHVRTLLQKNRFEYLP